MRKIKMHKDLFRKSLSEKETCVRPKALDEINNTNLQVMSYEKVMVWKCP
jgi:hypothetical protein